jgi:predicted NAD/FAD-binding protein
LIWVASRNEKNKNQFIDTIYENLNQDYNTLSRLFSEIEVTTEHFFIAQKLKRPRIMVYDGINHKARIAIQLNYSNVYLLISLKK